MSTPANIQAAIAAIDTDLQASGREGLYDDQVAALQARCAPAEAIRMIDDLRDRVGGISDATRRIAVEAVLVHTALSQEQRAFVEERLLQIVNEAGAHLVTGKPVYPGGKPMPDTIVSFAELHDYCDANELGGLCDEAVIAQGNRLFPGRTDDETVATQDWMEMSNRIQMLADEWIAMAGDVRRWRGRAEVVGRYREALPRRGELEVQPPLGWWDVTGPNDGCANFACGFYRLWIDTKQSAQEGGTPQFILELLDEQSQQVCAILSTDDWIEMQACIAALPSSRDYLASARKWGA